MRKCLICKNESEKYFKNRILNKYEVDYFYCKSCHFIFTEKPYWLEEAYSNAIVDSDVGIMERNAYISKTSFKILHLLFGREVKGLDLAAGYGIFVRMMRDSGHDFYWSDKYAQNIFAKGFEGSSVKKYDVITAFEVLEHLEDPISWIKEHISISKERTLLFSTDLFDTLPKKDWPYFSFQNGQHISFFSKVSLQNIAIILNLKYYTYKNFHILTEKKIPLFKFLFLASNYSDILLRYLKFKYLSKTQNDQKTLISN